jgi:fermentation-respiration switch protein FrsA (DUF1100 family)
MTADTPDNSGSSHNEGWIEWLARQPMLKSPMLAVIDRLQDSFIFKPHAPGVKSIRDPSYYGLSHTHKTHVYTEDGEKIALWYQPPSDPSKPMYLVFHGNEGHWGDVGLPRPDQKEGFDRRYRINLLKTILDNGAGFIAVHLRGYGQSYHGTPSEKGFGRDVDAVLQWIDGQPEFAKKPVISLGESMGGAVAAMAAQKMTESKRPYSVLGMVCPFSSMAERAHDTFPQFSTDELSQRLRHPFNNTERVNKVSPSSYIYIGHAVHDETTGYEHSARLNAAVASHPERLGKDKSVYFMPLSGGHLSWDPKEIIEDTLYLHDKWLRKRGPADDKGIGLC